MPVQYTGIYEEHLATRNAAGLFDVSHMGVYDVRGADAASFLDAVCGNDCGGLLPGESLYSHFLHQCGCDRRHACLSPRLG
jgi:glycine cleavage system aminomethyltransferase T